MHRLGSVGLRVWPRCSTEGRRAAGLEAAVSSARHGCSPSEDVEWWWSTIATMILYEIVIVPNMVSFVVIVLLLHHDNESTIL